MQLPFLPKYTHSNINQRGVSGLRRSASPPGKTANDYLLKRSLLSELPENSNALANGFWQVRADQWRKGTERSRHDGPRMAAFSKG